jgi:ATP-dependent DNA helicase RecG
MRPLVEATVGDDTGVVRATFFNQPWLVKRYRPGTRLALHGKYQARNRFAVQAHAPTGEALAGAEAVAHYPATQGLSSTQILALVKEHAPQIADVIDPLPARLRAGEVLPDRAGCLAAAHFPLRDGDPEEARRRLAFDELLLAQLALRRRRRALEESSSAARLDAPRDLTERWLSELLPFELTGEQRLALDEIDADIGLGRPMQRLLMGEVGSGKTVIALYALLRAVENDYQGALMAPTETLAEQHFATLQSLLPGEAVPVGLLTGSTPGVRASDLRGKLASGELALVVGTHALIEAGVQFARLAVAVVDEQHRFGVRQRAALHAKGPGGLTPHVLHMTATPIPRTLALAGYGDLDFTVLRELPRGRRPIETFVCSTAGERARAYERIREELRDGRQAYVVCPLVAESELLEARAATVEFERLRDGEFAESEVVLLHGQMPSTAKQQAMAAFSSGRAQVLVATSVIEVGIDVANATIMLVEDAERYGISQLHQLRGRIGRGEHPSVCLLFGPKESRRLKALAAHRDGFKLAEIDLELRGEGELIGTRQHGQAAFRVAELPRDAELLERAAFHARRILEFDPRLERPEHALMLEALGRAYGADAEAPIPA